LLKIKTNNANKVMPQLSVGNPPCHAGSSFFIIKHSAWSKKDSSWM